MKHTSLLSTVLSRVFSEHFKEQVEHFRFSPSQPPILASFHDVVVICVVYFLAVRALKFFMRTRKPFDLKYIVALHSGVLTVASFILFASFVVILYEKSQSFTPWEMICSTDFHQDGNLQFLYYINYLVKWYELLDTVILVLRKKEVIFLHEYHHAATLFLCWIQMDQHSTVQWVPIAINLLVHVFMYYYYTLAALKIPVWWKMYLTQLQIVQFVIDIAACEFMFALLFVCSYNIRHLCLTVAWRMTAPFPWQVSTQAVMSLSSEVWGPRPLCNGTLKGALVGVGVIFSYLVLFVIFYLQTVSDPMPGEEADRSAVSVEVQVEEEGALVGEWDTCRGNETGPCKQRRWEGYQERRVSLRCPENNVRGEGPEVKLSHPDQDEHGDGEAVGLRDSQKEGALRGP
eukprot:750196-Hanusia_phi.AAC.2